MRLVTDRFKAAVTASHVVATAVTLLPASGDQQTIVSAIDGTVTLDQTAATRGRLDLTIVDDGTLGLVPKAATDPLSPYGNEIQVSRGVLYDDASSELASLGVFRIDEVDVTETSGGVEIKVAGLDRSARIIDAEFEEPYQVAASTNYATAILAVIQDAYPDVQHRLTATSAITPGTLIAQEGDDRWAFAQSMATAIGMALYFDGDGVLVLEPVTAVGSSPAVVQLTEGVGGVLVQAGRSWKRQGAYNRYIATGENTGDATAPARGVATDDNPLSPTYYYGPFGKVPGFYQSQLITTDAQAQDAAAAMLAKQLGTSESVSFGAVVNPALEPGDVARIARAKLGINEDHILDQIVIPLAASGTMTGQTRAVQVYA